MKKFVLIVLVLAMLAVLTACGDQEEETIIMETYISEEAPAESTLSPREQFQKQKEAMAELQGKMQGGEGDTELATEAVLATDAPVEVESLQSAETSSFSAGGFTLILDSSFKADYTQTDGLMSYWHKNGDSFSYTMKIGITPTPNSGGYKTSQEAAEAIAAQKPDQRTVECANGVYYIVQTGSSSVIKAYYVDDSGYFWIIDGTTSSQVDFDEYKDQLVQFCTTGHIG